MRLVFDTETSGLLRDDAPVWDASQPHLVQLGAQLFDGEWRRVGNFTTLIKPDGWSIEPEAEAVHGISEARAYKYGIALPVALATFAEFVSKARVIAAHHANFDRKVIDIQLAKLKASGDWWKRKATSIRCTMEESAPICKIPGEYGWKFPSLEEAHRFFYPALPYTTTHDAERDVRACAAVLIALTKKENEIERDAEPPNDNRVSPISQGDNLGKVFDLRVA